MCDFARERIEALQPWRAGYPGVWSHRSQVEALDNTQKHSLLLTGVVGLRMKNFVLNDNGVARLIPEAFFPILPSAMIIASDVKPATRSREASPMTSSFTSPDRRRARRWRISLAT